MKTSGETGVSLGRFVLVVVVGGVLALAGIRVGFDAGHVAQEAATFVSTKGTTRIAQTVGAVVSPRTVAVKVPATVTATRTVVRRPVVTEPPMGNGITVNYGAFAGQVRIFGAQWHSLTVAMASHVDMLARYTGRPGCPIVKLFGVAATLFDSSGRIAEVSGTGASDLVRGVSFPLTIQFFTKVKRGRIELVVNELRC